MIRIFHNKKVARLMWIALLAIIGPAFLFWGVGSYQRSEENQEGDFGKVFGKRVSRQEYVDALKAAQLQMRLQFGEAYNELQKMIDFKSLALQRLVLLAEARRRRIRVADAEVVGQIRAEPSFQRKGVFDQSLYETAVKYGLRVPARAYEEQIRQNLMIRKLAEQAVAAPAVSEDEVRQAYRKEHEQLNLEYVSAIPADFAAGIDVSEKEAEEFFSAHSLDFKLPLSFNLEYVSTDKEHQVTAVNSRLEKEPLEKIAADMGLAMKETGLFTETDAIPGIGWSRELSASLAGAKPGQVFAPLEMEKKYYLLRLKERKEPYVPEFGVVKEKVKAAVTRERSRGLAREKIDAFFNRLKEDNARPMKKLAASLDLKTGETGLFRFGSYLEGIGASDSFYTVGSALKEGEASAVIEMPSGFFIVKLKNKQPVDEQKFSQEKESVRAELAREKKQEAFGKFIEDLMKKAL